MFLRLSKPTRRSKLVTVPLGEPAQLRAHCPLFEQSLHTASSPHVRGAIQRLNMPVRKDAGPNSGFFSLKRRKSPDDSDASNDARRRITIACLRCRHRSVVAKSEVDALCQGGTKSISMICRKIRCDGSDPCNKCNSAGAECEYYAVTKFVHFKWTVSYPSLYILIIDFIAERKTKLRGRRKL